MASLHRGKHRQCAHFTGVASAPRFLVPQQLERGTHQNHLGNYPEDPRLNRRGKASLLTEAQPNAAAGFQEATQASPTPRFPGSECHGLSDSPCSCRSPDLTFCQRDSREASDEQAATNQQLPTWPWCRSWELMPSMKRRGSSQISCREGEKNMRTWGHRCLTALSPTEGRYAANHIPKSCPNCLPPRPEGISSRVS